MPNPARVPAQQAQDGVRTPLPAWTPTVRGLEQAVPAAAVIVQASTAL